MALIHISQKELCDLSSITQEQVEPILTELGIPLEEVDGDDLSLEITPNRPDWLSVEGVARSCRSYSKKNPIEYTAQKSEHSIIVDPSIKYTRPYIGSALIKGLKLDEEILASLIQLQEKLHDTLGRHRKKMAIGLHDAKDIKSPFRYLATGLDENAFIPLDSSVPMTPMQILQRHEKGLKFAHLIGDKAPLIVDKDFKVLSMPPIINGELTRVTKDTTDILIDCTGTHKKTVQIAVNILAAALVDRGAKAYTVEIDSMTYPLFEPYKTKISLKEINSLLGTKLDQKQISYHLARLGHQLSKNIVKSPSFRADIMHPVDLAEDIAISIGYNNLTPQIADIITPTKITEDSRIHEACLGLGYYEIMSWILTNHILLERSKVDMSKAQKVKNPLTEEFTTLRPALYPNFLKVFADSKSEPMPQNLYELGPIISEQGSLIQKEHLCMASCQPKSSYSLIQSHLLGLLDSLKKEVEFDAIDIDGFIPGRCANILSDGKKVGIIGEIHPEVLDSFDIEQPISLFEIDASYLRD